MSNVFAAPRYIEPVGSLFLVPALGACVGFPGACGAPADSDCEPGCPSLACDLDDFGFTESLGL